jgi:hypothetical protein
MKNSKQILNDVLTKVNSIEFENEVSLGQNCVLVLSNVVSLLQVNEIEKALLVLDHAKDLGLIDKPFRNAIGGEFGDPYIPAWFATVEYPIIPDDAPISTPVKEPVKEPVKVPVKVHVPVPDVAHVSKKKHA